MEDEVQRIGLFVATEGAGDADVAETLQAADDALA